MPLPSKPPSRDLSVYLLADGIDPNAVLTLGQHPKQFDIQAGNVAARLYVIADSAHPPRWARLFSGQVEPGALGLIRSVSAVLVLTVAGRVFALTFGRGRFLLRPGCWELRFGLRVALNAIDPKKVRSVDKQTLDSLGRHSRIQASRAARVLEFGIDIDRDLIHEVTGEPRTEQLGIRLTGRDALRAAAHVDLAGLPKLLKSYLDESQGISYKKEYPWIDQVKDVTDASLIDTLDKELADKLNQKAVELVELAVPSIIDWGEVSAFRYQGLGESLERNELLIADAVALFEEKGRVWSPAEMRSVKITTIDPDGSQQARWSIYQCLHAELAKGGKIFVLSAGRWYEVNKGLVEDVNEAFTKMKRLTPGLAAYKDKHEAAYCERVAAAGSPWALMDRKPIRYGGGRSQVEFCDLYSGSDRTLLHVKRYAGSAPLSHLFAQALVSGETFKLEIDFRKKLNGKLPAAHRLADAKPTPEGFSVVLGIVKAGTFDLPFFSKVTLRNTAKRLDGYGFKVMLAPIAVDSAFAKTKKAPKKKH